MAIKIEKFLTYAVEEAFKSLERNKHGAIIIYKRALYLLLRRVCSNIQKKLLNCIIRIIMKDMNRIMILILLIGLLYALYNYQQRLNDGEVTPPKPTKTKKMVVRRSPKKQKVVEEYDHISQMSLGSLKELESGYKKDSLVGNGNDSTNGDSLAFLDGDSKGNDSFFFQ